MPGTDSEIVRPLLFALLLLLGACGLTSSQELLRVEEPLSSPLPDPPDLQRLRARFEARARPADTPFTVAFVPLEEVPLLPRSIRRTIRHLSGRHGPAVEVLRLRRGTASIEAIAGAISDPRLVCLGTSCRLRLPLFVDRGATLIIADRELRLQGETGAALFVAGELFLDRAFLRGFEGDAPAAFEGADRFRPFVTVYEGGSAFIRDSRLEHLGYFAALAYGLAFGRIERKHVNELPPPTGVVFRSRLSDLFYALYTHAAEDLVVLDNRIEGSIRYGIDPHDDSRRFVIAGNHVTGTRERHGIVLSRRVTDSWILQNVSSRNAGSGIVIDRWSDGNRIMGNVVHGNRRDGIVVFESGRLLIARNRIEANARAGVRIRNGTEVVLLANRIAANGEGIRIYSGPAPRRQREGPVIEQVAVMLAANDLRANGRADLILRGNVTELALVGSRRLHPLAGPSGLPVIDAPLPWKRALESLPPGFTGVLRPRATTVARTVRRWTVPLRSPPPLSITPP